MNFTNPYLLNEIPLVELLLNLAIGMILAVVWAKVISKYSRIMVDTRQYMPMFLLLIPTMILIITIIKSSIALSLGLVGALSIVRFRTPIKDPEELLHIFVAIAIGLGLGANQALATIVASVVIIMGYIPYQLFGKGKPPNNFFAELIIHNKEDGPRITLDEINNILQRNMPDVHVRRLHTSPNSIEIVIDLKEANALVTSNFENVLKDKNLDYQISLIENRRIITLCFNLLGFYES